MSEARGRSEWERASWIMALVANVFRDPAKSKAARPEDFNPYRMRAESRPVVSAKILKQLWVRE